MTAQANPNSPAPIDDRLAVPMKEAARMLGCGKSTLYELLKTGDLANFYIGRTRRVVVASILSYVERRSAAQAGSPSPRSAAPRPS